MDIKNKQQLIEQNFDSYTDDLKKLVGAPSENGEAAPGAPFGKGVGEALGAMLGIAKDLGFKTYADPDGYYGYAEIGDGKELFGILGHLDVVPPGPRKDWTYEPFTLTQTDDGKFYGRGTQDDKGPTLASMYALKLLLDDGAKLKRRVRFIFGTNEELLWGGIKAYMKKEEHPSLGFTPDSDFPLIYAEKGLVNYELTSAEKTDATLAGGTAYNAVPAEATTLFDAAIESALKDLGYKYESDGETITAMGKTVHASVADEGVNAVAHLAEAMAKAKKDNAMIRFIAEKGTDPNGKNIFGDVADEVSGKLTFNIGVADIGKDKQMIGIDMRVPVTYDQQKIDDAMDKAASEYGVDVKKYDYLRPINIDVNSELVQSLMRAYQEVTGDTKSEPMTSGGATYARSMDNIVAFGAVFPGHEETEHQANEHVAIADLKKAMEVYMRAFELLVVE